MHQDEHNQRENPEAVAAPAQGETDLVEQPAPPITSTDPSLASAASGTTELPEPALAEAPVEAITCHAPAGESEGPAPASTAAGDETPWIAAEAGDSAPQAVLAAERAVTEPPHLDETPVFASPAWNASDESPTTMEQSAPSEPASMDESSDSSSWQHSPTPEGAETFAGDAVPAPPPAWMTPPITDAATVAEAAQAPEAYSGPAEPHVQMPQGGPNWMLAFVCGWAAFTSFMEAPVAYAAKETLINGSTVTLTASDRMYGGLGFALLGLGLLLFGIEALLWGRRRRGVSALLTIGLPVIVSLAGIVCLILSHYPGSRI